MKIIKRMFELSLTEREAKKVRRMMAIIIMPIMVFYMTSMNFLALEMMRVSAEDVAVTSDPPSINPSVDEKKDEPVKEDLKTEPEKEEVKVPETPTKTENTVTDDTVKTTPETTIKTITPSVENKTTSPVDDKKEEVKEATWVIDGKTAAISPVELGKIYKAPQNDKVSVTFTKLPEKPGSLAIKEIKLTSEEQVTLGALTDTAYDITSDMKNGTFEYDLTLPKPENIDNVQIKYAEDESKLNETKTIEDNVEVKDNKVEASGVNHFTVFIVGWNFPNDPDDAIADGGTAINGTKTISVIDTNDVRFTQDGATTNSMSAKGWKDGSGTKYWQVEFVSTGYSSLSISSKQRSTKGGPKDFKIQYKIGSGGEWADVSSGIVPAVAENWTSGIVNNLALPDGCDDQSSVYLRWIMTSNVSVDNKAVDNGGVSNIDDIAVYGTETAPDEEYPDETAPTVPTNGQPNDSYKTTNNFYFTWDASTGDSPITYEFQSSGSNVVDGAGSLVGAWNSIINGNSEQNNLTSPTIHSTGAPDGTYYWQVRAIDESGNKSAWSEVWKMTIDTHAPGVPAHVSPADKTFTTTANLAKIDWSDVSDSSSPVSYFYQSSTSSALNPDGTFVSPAYTSGALSASEIPTGGTPASTYYWHVRAVDAAGNSSAWSNAWRVTVDNSAPTVDLVFSGTGSSVKSFQAVFSEDVNESEAENPANYFLQNWPGAGGSGNLDGHADISYDSSSHTATIAFTTSGWYVSPEQEWGVENIHDLAGNMQSANPYSETSTPMVAPTVPGVPTSSPNPTNVFSQNWTWLPSTDIGGSGVKGYFWNIYNTITDTNSGWSWIGNVLGVSTNLTDGQYQMQVKAEDNAGNVSGEVSSGTLTVDSVNPSKPVISSPTDGAYFRTAPIRNEWTASSDSGSGIKEYRVEYIYEDGHTFSGGPYRTTASTWRNHSPSISEQGGVTIRVQALDNAGNYSEWSEPVHYHYDATAPVISAHNDEFAEATGPSGAIVNYTNPNATDNTDGTFAATCAPASGSLFPMGTTVVTCNAMDHTGNSAIATTFNVTVCDTTAPIVEITAPNTSPVSGNVEIRGTVTEVNPHHYWLAIYNKSNSQYIYSITVNHSDEFTNRLLYSWNTAAVSDGVYQIKFAERDAADNRSPDFVREVTVDNTAPTSTITSPSDGEDGIVYLNEWSGSISGTAIDNLSGVAGVKLSIQRDVEGVVEYWDGLNWQSGEDEKLFDASGTDSWSYTLTSTEEAAYTIKSHAIDNAGNIENTFTLKIVLDKTIPTVSLSISPANPDGDNDWYVSTPEITLSANDKNLDRIEYRIDSTSGTWVVYLAPVKINDGRHIFYYRSIDKAGNISNSGAKSVKVDTREPDNVKNLDAEYDEENDSVKLSWDADDSDISEVYIYQGKSREFHVNSSLRIAKNDDNDESYTDDNIQRGEKYYYKFVTKDEAGNTSDVKIISVKIPQDGGEAVVTDEGTEVLPQGTVLGEQSKEEVSGEQSSGNSESNNEGNQQVAGEETSGENSNLSKNENWPYYVTGGVLLLLAGIFWRRRRKKEMTA